MLKAFRKILYDGWRQFVQIDDRDNKCYIRGTLGIDPGPCIIQSLRK